MYTPRQRLHANVPPSSWGDKIWCSNRESKQKKNAHTFSALMLFHPDDSFFGDSNKICSDSNSLSPSLSVPCSVSSLQFRDFLYSSFMNRCGHGYLVCIYSHFVQFKSLVVQLLCNYVTTDYEPFRGVMVYNYSFSCQQTLFLSLVIILLLCWRFIWDGFSFCSLSCWSVDNFI